jgi:YaiO family outer membrane protein
MLKILTIISLLVSVCSGVRSQTQMSSDQLFQDARKAAFKLKDYDKARSLAKEALSISPNYNDIMVFLGRLYAWTGNYDSARYYFNVVLDRDPSDVDASLAAIDLEYWNDHYDSAMNICDRALQITPASEELLLRKVKIFNATRQYRNAKSGALQLLQKDSANQSARKLLLSIRRELAKNKISLDYDYTTFNKQYSQPWQLASLSYGRSTKLGTIIFRMNYANRFGNKGYQGEMDAYPRISKTFYSYLNFGYSGNEGTFPKFRAGFSLYANLPRSFEAELGTRYLYFTSPTNIFTAYVGKYYKNFLFGLRTYITPSNQSVSQSYSVSARYYTKGADDYIALSAGTGVSPDDNNQNIQFDSKLYKLSSKKISADYKHTIMKWYIVSLGIELIRQEYIPDQWGNQWDFTMGIARRF